MDNVAYNSMCSIVRSSFDERLHDNPGQVPPITLAYIGDTVFDLFVRCHLVHSTTLPPAGLHKRAAAVVCAHAQAMAFRTIEPMLTENEMRIFKRGRNAHSTVPHNATQEDYRAATGLEALIGYLFLSDMDERLIQLMTVIINNT